MASSPSERDRQETTMGIMFDPSKPLLFQLPKGLFVTILSDWMGLEGIHNFDSAILSHKYRESVLECLAAIRSPRLGRFGDETQRNTHSNNDVTSDDSPSFFSCSSLRWLSLRRIQVEHVNLDLVIKNENLIAPRQGLDKEVELLRDIDLPWLRSLQVLQSRGSLNPILVILIHPKCFFHLSTTDRLWTQRSRDRIPGENKPSAEVYLH